MNYFLPLLVCSSSAFGVVNLFQPSIFELGIFLRQLHFMPNIINQLKIKSGNKKFRKILTELDQEDCLTLDW